VAVAVARQRDANLMVKVVGPDSIESEAAVLRRLHQPWVVVLILGNQEEVPPRRQHLPHARRDLRKNVGRAVVENSMGRVEPQPIQMVLPRPGARVGQEEGTYRLTLRSVKVQRVTPGGLVPTGEVRRA